MVVSAGFGLLARARRDRALHADGVVWAATTTFVRPVAGVASLGAARPVDSLMRLSRAIGLPAAAPDVLGLALRLHDADGPGRPIHLLLASSPPPPLHCMLAPARSFERTWFTGLLPYRVGECRTVLVARASGAGRFALATADPGRRRPRPLAEIRVTGRLDPAPPEASSFDPVLHAAGGLRQDAGRLNGLRERAYRASRQGGTGPGPDAGLTLGPPPRNGGVRGDARPGPRMCSAPPNGKVLGPCCRSTPLPGSTGSRTTTPTGTSSTVATTG